MYNFLSNHDLQGGGGGGGKDSCINILKASVENVSVVMSCPDPNYIITVLRKLPVLEIAIFVSSRCSNTIP